MWFFKLVLLLTMIASWIPKDHQEQAKEHTNKNPISREYAEGDEQEEEDEGEELAA